MEIEVAVPSTPKRPRLNVTAMRRGHMYQMFANSTSQVLSPTLFIKLETYAGLPMVLSVHEDGKMYVTQPSNLASATFTPAYSGTTLKITEE